jgi:tRNA pseudouridine55 synthase
VSDAARRPPPAPDGLLIVDKPAGWTSHDVVARTRWLARTRKVGHAGTLDPMATGVLVLGIGRATRLLGHLATHDKDYDAVIRLGAATNTDDAEGDVTATSDARWTQAQVADAMLDLTGPISQVPPAFSAIKVEGRRSYARARAGESFELAARTVVVARFALLAVDGTDVRAAVTCSSGTYIRALARDLGAALGCGGHLAGLRRTRVGGYGLDLATPLDRLEQDALPVLPLRDAVAAGFPRRDLDAKETALIRYGRRLAPSHRDGPVGAFGPDGQVLALLEDVEDAARPLVVFAPA